MALRLATTSVFILGIAQFSVGHDLEARQSNGTSTSPFLKSVSNYVDSLSDDLWQINREIHDNPELGFEEENAHKVLTDYIESQDGWSVRKSAYNISTAFVAVFNGTGDGPVVSFNAEYDALPGLGHACGHNLIAMASLSGALAAAEIMRKEKLAGKVVLYGTPAEEGGGGKIQLLEAGAYSDYGVNISLISHPGVGEDTAYMATTSTDRFEVEYYGREAHAAAAPWEGINAQDALMLAYSAMSMLRQQTRSTDIIQGFVSSGGTRTNIIPKLSQGSFAVRASDDAALHNLTERVFACFEAGAVATGAELNITMRPYGYSNMVTNDALAESYYQWYGDLGHDLMPISDAKKEEGSASSDQGNISHEIPSISALFGIANEDGSEPVSGPHTAPFEKAAGSSKAFKKSLEVGKGLAGVAIDVLTVDGFLDQVMADFNKNQKVTRARRSVSMRGKLML